MHGLINRAIQSFFCVTYGDARWKRVTRIAELGFTDFEPMLTYDDDQFERLVSAISREAGRPREDLFEDLGTFLVSHPDFEALRRLLRFSGQTYVDFLYSLDDLADRVRLAVSDLVLPQLELREHTPGLFSLLCQPGLPGFGSVLVGLLRAMADDYGALVMLDHRGRRDGCEVISVALVESAFAEGRRFDLGAGLG